MERGKPGGEVRTSLRLFITIDLAGTRKPDAKKRFYG
jgi:hypothetical protein